MSKAGPITYLTPKREKIRFAEKLCPTALLKLFHRLGGRTVQVIQ
jgi:hypothetical protein